jgi:fused signal recognition particle receptor
MFGILKKVFGKTAEAMHEVVEEKKSVLSKEEFEEVLLEADVDYDIVERLLTSLPSKINRIQAYNSLISLFQYDATYIEPGETKPFVEMIIGVNGAGKTTTIAKLANRYKKEGASVILGAGDTFRAAAIEQLSRWAERLGVPIVATKQGHDPSAVVFDTIRSAQAKGIEHVIIDTAGRLHTQTNLAEELKKMVRVADKAMSGAPHRKLLVLDGTQGSSSVNQARAFDEMIGIDGIIVTKLDGTAKGGALFTIAAELKMPIYFIGTGETPEDLLPFNARDYVNTILDEIYLS